MKINVKDHSTLFCPNMKFCILAVTASCLLLACTKKEIEEYVPVPPSSTSSPSGPQSGVTGKGNGGNEMKMSKNQILEKLHKIKPSLIKLFTGLKYLMEAEKLSPGITDLAGDKELQELITKMTTPSDKHRLDVFSDIRVENNFLIQNDPCFDFRGFSHAGAANAGETGGQICLSLEKLQKASIRDAEFAVQVMILALVAHEFAHHYLHSGNDEKDEQMAVRIQQFISGQMNKYEAIETDGLVTIVAASEELYLDRFLFEAKELYQKAHVARELNISEDQVI